MKARLAIAGVMFGALFCCACVEEHAGGDAEARALDSNPEAGALDSGGSEARNGLDAAMGAVPAPDAARDSGSGTEERADGSRDADAVRTPAPDAPWDSADCYEEGPRLFPDLEAPVRFKGCSECPGLFQELDVTGDSPEGPVHFSRATVSYETGLGEFTTLTLHGTRNEEPVTLILTKREDRTFWSPGSYRTGSEHAAAEDAFAWVSPAIQDRDSPFETLVQVEEHVPPKDFPSMGAPIHFHGKVVVQESGWSLTVAFDLERACNVDVLLI